MLRRRLADPNDSGRRLSDIPRDALNFLRGGARGALAAAAGMPGDLEGLGRGVYRGFAGPNDFLTDALSGLEEKTMLYNTDDMLKRLPDDPEGDVVRRMGSNVGEFSPLATFGPLRAAIKLAKLKRAKLATSGAIGTTLAAEAAAKGAGYAEGGPVRHDDDLEDLLDTAFMNAKFGD